MNDPVSPYITPDEAIALTPYSTFADYMTARHIMRAYRAAIETGNTLFDRDWECAVIFSAGRIAGIRQERARRKSREQSRAIELLQHLPEDKQRIVYHFITGIAGKA